MTQTQYDKAAAAAYVGAKSVNEIDSHCYYFSLYKAMGSVRDLDVLDLATGTGRIALEMRKRGARSICGVDESSAMLEIAEKESKGHPPIRYLHRTVGTMGQIGEYDVITAGWLTHYASSPEELVAMCRDIAANLRPNGRYIALNPNPNFPIGGDPKYGYRIEFHTPIFREGSQMRIHLFGNGTKVPPILYYHWNFETYVAAFRAAGLELKMLVAMPSDEAIALKGERWWREYLQRPNAAVFVAKHISAG